MCTQVLTDGVYCSDPVVGFSFKASFLMFDVRSKAVILLLLACTYVEVLLLFVCAKAVVLVLVVCSK